MKRDVTIDISKGIGIILVVIGHSGAPFAKFIYLFHMALFFIISGWCYNFKYSGSISGIKELVINRMKSLYVPFVVFNILFFALNNVFLDVNIYTKNPDFLNFEYSVPGRLTSHLSVHDFIISVMKVITMGGGAQLTGPSWFLIVLLTVSIMFCLIDYLIKRKRKYIQYHIVICFVFLMLGYFLSVNKIMLPRLLSVTFSVYYLFAFGCVLSRYRDEFKSIACKSSNFIISISLVLLLICLKFGTVTLALNQFVNPLFFIVASLSGFVFIYIASMYVEFKKISVYLSYLGRNTMPILFLHCLSFKIVTWIQIMFYNEPKYMLASFPIWHSDYWWVGYTFVGVLIPLLLNYIYQRLLTVGVSIAQHSWRL